MGIRFQADVCPTITFWPALQPKVSQRQWVSGLLPPASDADHSPRFSAARQKGWRYGTSPPRLGPQWPVVLNPQLWTLKRACPGHPTPYPGPFSVVLNHPTIWFDTGIEFRLFWDYSRFSSGLQQHSSTFFQIYNSQLFYSLHLKMWPTGRPETSVRKYHYTLRNNPEERSSHPLRGGSLKSL